ncbi:hypothetical protein [Rhodococcus sp. Leaf233]|uniref:hypothetical protein n=1 Tax=Rhodococcus sp. Leaf233 TaxID=1736302 RepID=UPI00071005A6|nr:hypothetical protein [Rhodococcus sp. Leaf233]KQU33589.1 hypothetical protein ASH04_07080 [Rhodococcus sp. Leaf233]
MEPEQILDNISALRNERLAAEAEIARIDLGLRHAIEAAFDAGVHAADIVRASNLSQARVYQIRRGTRR